MNIFKKIATPFIAIGRWIKETAWVQPLLIIGVIFGIIFCIPSITSAITAALAETDIDWYAQDELSLDGSYDRSSDANKFLKNYVLAQEEWENGNYTKAQETMKQYSSNNRFILFFVQEDCTACEETQEACEYLVDNWDSKINNETTADGTPITYEDFSYQSIICDQEIDNDYDEHYKTIKAFDYLYKDGDYYNLVEDLQSAIKYSNYYRYGTQSTTIKANLEKLVASDTSSTSLNSDFQTPLILEFDLNPEKNSGPYMISNVLYKLEGSDKYDRADFFVDLWKKKDVFSDTGK